MRKKSTDFIDSSRLLSAIIITFFVGFWTGCAELQKFVKTPDVSLDSFNFTNLSLNSVSSLVKVKVTNPNALPIPLGIFNYKLKLMGKDFTTGAIEPLENSLNGNQSTVISLPLSFSLTELKGIITSLGKSKEIPFEVEGDMKVGPFSLPLSKKGILPKPELPKVSLEGLKTEKMGIEGAEMSLNLKVSNPNAFPLLLGKFIGEISLGGSSLATTEGLIANVNGGGTSTLKLPFKIKTLDAGSSILSVITGGGKSGGMKTVSIKGNWIRQSLIPGGKEIVEAFEKTANLSQN